MVPRTGGVMVHVTTGTFAPELYVAPSNNKQPAAAAMGSGWRDQRTIAVTTRAHTNSITSDTCKIPNARPSNQPATNNSKKERTNVSYWKMAGYSK